MDYLSELQRKFRSKIKADVWVVKVCKSKKMWKEE